MLWTRTSTPWSGARDRLRTAAGGLLLAHQGMPAAISPASLCLLLGFLAMGGYLSRHFGKVRLASPWHG